MNSVDILNAVPVSGDGFSFLALFLQASLIVKLVMAGLLVASVWSWAIIIEKLISFGRARRETNRFEQLFWSGQSLEELYGSLSRQRTQAMGALFVAAMREWKRSVDGNPKTLRGILLRVEKVMDVTISRELERLEKRLRRYKRRLRDHHADTSSRASEPASAMDYTLEESAAVDDAPGGHTPVTIAEASTSVRRLSVSEAVMALDLADTPVVVFRNAGHGGINVVYRRRDGNIGWIDPGSSEAR